MAGGSRTSSARNKRSNSQVSASTSSSTRNEILDNAMMNETMSQSQRIQIETTKAQLEDITIQLRSFAQNRKKHIRKKGKDWQW